MSSRFSKIEVKTFPTFTLDPNLRNEPPGRDRFRKTSQMQMYREETRKGINLWPYSQWHENHHLCRFSPHSETVGR